MTTSHSPLSQLKAQADKIAATLKAAERGEQIDVRFAEKIEAARSKDSFKVGIVMDSKGKEKALCARQPYDTFLPQNLPPAS